MKSRKCFWIEEEDYEAIGELLNTADVDSKSGSPKNIGDDSRRSQ